MAIVKRWRKWTALICTIAVCLVPIDAQLSARCASTVRRSRTCYQLYGSPSDSYTWQQSYDSCLAGGGELVTVDNEQAQDGLINLASAITGGGDRHVWIAGRLSQDRNWTYVDGRPADELSLNESCAMLSLDGSQGRLIGCNCEDNFWNALCQYDEPATVGCYSILDFLYIGKCYRVLENPQGFHWHKARQLCRSEITGGDLAHTHIHTVEFWRTVQAHLGNEIRMWVWVGLTSRHWVWRTEIGDIPMVYNEFRGGVGHKSYVFMDAGDDGKWDAKELATDTSPYYICRTLEIITTPTTTTTTTPPSTTPKTPSTARTPAPPPSPSPSPAPPSTIIPSTPPTNTQNDPATTAALTSYTGTSTACTCANNRETIQNCTISSIIVGVICIALTAVASVFITRWKCPGIKPKTTTEHHYINTEASLKERDVVPGLDPNKVTYYNDEVINPRMPGVGERIRPSFTGMSTSVAMGTAPTEYEAVNGNMQNTSIGPYEDVGEYNRTASVDDVAPNVGEYNRTAMSGQGSDYEAMVGTTEDGHVRLEPGFANQYQHLNM